MKKIYVILFVSLLLFGFGAEQFWDLTSNSITTIQTIDLSLKGDLLFDSDNSYDLGTSAIGVRDIYLADDLVMGYDEQLTNPNDSSMSFVFDDSLDVWTLYLESSVDTPYIADDMAFELVCYANDDSSGLTEWSVIKTTMSDVSDESEDSKMEFKTFADGSQVTPLTLTGSNASLAGNLSLAASKHIEASDSTGGVILLASDGTRWKIKVSPSGAVSADSTGLN